MVVIFIMESKVYYRMVYDATVQPLVCLFDFIL